MNLNFITTFCDAPEPWQLGIQDPATPIMEGMVLFHNYLVFFLIFIGLTVCWVLVKIFMNFNYKVHPISWKFTHSSILEIIWTILPALILVVIAIPSFALLYSLDELIDPSLTLKIIGHQWYWSYEFSDDFKHLNCNNEIKFDSYIKPSTQIKVGQFRLLETDNKVFLPEHTHIRLLVTSSDVLHSWAVPSFGIKIDACPGRLSQASLFIKRRGLYYGQCSEICGVNHGFMPIVIQTIAPDVFDDMITYFYAE